MVSGFVLKNIAVEFSNKQFIRNVSISLHPGELHILAGPNGSGKSSLLKALAGHPDYMLCDGDISLDGIALREMLPEERSHCGLFLAFQSPIALPGVTIAQLLRTAREERMTSGKPIDVMAFYSELYAALDLLGMERSWASRSANDGFSGGEAKRCELLQILLLRPKYLRLDEIDSGLDIDAINVVIKILQRLRNDGIGILLVTHRQSLFKQLNPDKIHVLRDGQLLCSGGDELADTLLAKGFNGL
jgi:Fe-S cluster assembly ATP-binding protein